MFKLVLKGVRPYRFTGTYLKTAGHYLTFFRIDGYDDQRLTRLIYTYVDEGNHIDDHRLVISYISVKDLEDGIRKGEYVIIDEDEVPRILLIKKEDHAKV